MRLFSARDEISQLPWYRVVLTEALAMLIFTYTCAAVTAQVLIGDKDGSLMLERFWGDNSTIALGCGLGLAMAFMLAGNVFHPHLNPAVTATLCLFGDVSVRLVPFFWLAQLAGATIGTAMVISIHGNRLFTLPDEIGRRSFASYPELMDFNRATVLWDICWSAGVYMLVYLAAYDRRNIGGNIALSSVAVGVTQAALIMASGSLQRTTFLKRTVT